MRSLESAVAENSGVLPSLSWKHAILPPAAAIVLATATLGRDRIPMTVRRPVAKALFAVWRPLRELHSGHVGDQIAWLTVGVALFAGAFSILSR